MIEKTLTDIAVVQNMWPNGVNQLQHQVLQYLKMVELLFIMKLKREVWKMPSTSQDFSCEQIADQCWIKLKPDEKKFAKKFWNAIKYQFYLFLVHFLLYSHTDVF